MTSPFKWRDDPRPSIFATDPAFTPRSSGKTNSEMQTESIERRRAKGEMPGHIDNLGKSPDKRLEQFLAYKQFAVYSKARADKAKQLKEKQCQGQPRPTR